MSASPAARPIERVAGLLLLKPGEAAPVIWSFAYFFCLLCSYFTLRPLRETFAVTSGSETVPLLFTGTFVVMLLLVPVFGTLVSRFSKRVFLPLVYLFFIANLLIFYVLLASDWNSLWVGRVFFVWLSVFNMFVVSVFWSFMADIFSSRQARRLFALISAGGSAGAILGPLLTAWLAPLLGTANLLLVASAWLCLALVCQTRLMGWQQERSLESVSHVIGGSIWAGATILLRSRFLLKIAAVLALFTFLQTVVYNQQIVLVEAAYQDRSPTRFFALVDLGANVVSVLLQLLVTSRLLAWLGAARTLVIMPLFTLAGFVVLAVFPQVLVLGVFQALRRGGEYGLMKPARELLYTRVQEEARYKSKNFIDTFVYRGGDAASGWVYLGLSQLAGMSVGLIASIAVPVAGLWAWLSFRLGADFEGRKNRETVLPDNESR
ncbi:MAG: MFS transporter [Xanthomonadales bacterium]|nr:MFS transporter [Xanthomonadales bacterium]